ncbi:MAG: hypothetical protein IJJ25_10305 [Lachnospiraceae bacterium]|nr:hypothetical protein [Lachnospiraceae bacterium]
MKEQLIKWMPVIALACFAAAVFMIADGYFWPGIVFIGAGTSLSSATAVYKKKKEINDLRKR